MNDGSSRVAVLDEELCKPKKCGLECIIYCPINKTGGECIIQRPNDGKAVISEDLCTGCGICVKKCPFEAIVIVNLPKELGEHKIHQYGINSFRLYHLPTPKKGSVVGLLGRNGMGKSTIINILSGNLKPNFGEYNEKIEWNDVIENFHGTELKAYFQNLANGNLNLSIKPQLVYKIPKFFNGTAKEMLKKFDELDMFDLISEELGLKNSLNKNVSELSGGELQRLAVAVTTIKNADYYFFDEPSSYNDIYQRLAVAKVIQSLAKKGKSVMIIEHDLTLLDYLSDYIHILYGEPGAYGIVSSLQSTKVGINNFLDGFIPSENVRFREKKFRFDSFSPTEDLLQNTIVTQYSNLIKRFDSFMVKIRSGRIRKGEVIGVTGANALGKTTFMKIMAGIEKTDEGVVEINPRISYKPQYISQDYEGQIWEAAMTAPKFKLDNLVVFLDRNRIQQDGFTEDIMPIDPVRDKWLAFNWNVIEINGHKIEQIMDALNKAGQIKDKPTIIIANTIKGNGIKHMANNPQWHGRAPHHKQSPLLIQELEGDYMISPSIIAGEKENYEEKIRKAERAGADMIHLDVMDGKFVPNTTFLADTIKKLRPITNLPFDTHLMIEHPYEYIHEYIDASCDIITVHAETCNEEQFICIRDKVLSHGISLGIAINPETTFPKWVFPNLNSIDVIIIMSVHPGFSGQKFIPETTSKIFNLNKILKNHGFKGYIEADGGIDASTVQEVYDAGARIMVAGSAVFSNSDINSAIIQLRHKTNVTLERNLLRKADENNIRKDWLVARKHILIPLANELGIEDEINEF